MSGPTVPGAGDLNAWEIERQSETAAYFRRRAEQAPTGSVEAKRAAKLADNAKKTISQLRNKPTF
jgi:hypothetical protein